MKEQFEMWLKEICRWDRDDWFVHWSDKNNNEGGSDLIGRCYVYTHNYRYCIVAKKHEDGRTYLGCTMSCRMPRAGEDWTRGNDLPDGKFARETWNRIKNAIIQNELVKVVRRVSQELVDEVQEEESSIE